MAEAFLRGFKSLINPSASISRRLTALFLCLSFVGTMFLPTIAVYADSQEGKLKYPGALATQLSKTPLAADAAGNPATNAQFSATSGEPLSGPMSKSKPKHEEIVGKRTANSETFDLGNGQAEVRQYLNRTHYKTGDKWQKIDDTLVEDANAADSTNILGEVIAGAKGKLQKLALIYLTNQL